MLIVDDDEDLRATIRDYAVSLGIDVWEAPNGVQALLIVEHHRPSLVLLDLNMPRLGGFETLSQLRRIDGAMRVILMTGDRDEPTRRRIAALDLELLPKPLDFAALDRVFSAPGTDGAPASEAETPAPESTPSPPAQGRKGAPAPRPRR